jgi:polyhydroxybutyrate depolymerase
MERRVDDVGFISALLDTLIARHHADPSRIYVTGMSNGAMMSHRLGIALSARIAAIAPVVGALFGDETPPPSPVSAFIINGALDRSVPVDGGAPGGAFSNAWDGTHPVPAVQQGEFWARANGCESGADVRNEGAITIRRYRCPAGRGVEMRIVQDGGHSWPGGRSGSRRGDAPSTWMQASEAMWTFFKAHPRVTPPPAP